MTKTGNQMTSMVMVEVHYTPPGMGEEDSICFELHAAPGSRVVLKVAEAGKPQDSGETDGDWRKAVHNIVNSAGPGVWLSASEIRSRLVAAGIEMPHRSVLSMELGEMFGRGEIVRSGKGSSTRYTASIVSRTLRSGMVPENQIPGAQWLPKAIEAISQAGSDGLKVADIAAHVARDRKTIRPALQACVERGMLVYRENGPLSAYIHPDHA